MDKRDSVDKVKLSLLAMQRHSWEQGVAMQAFLELGDEETVVAMAQEAAYRCVPDGRVAMLGVQEGATDPCVTGEALLYAARVTGDASLMEAYSRLLSWALERAPRNVRGVCYHVTDRPEFWVDSMYMLPPFLAAAGYADEAMRQWDGYYQILRDPKTGLMRHIWDDEGQAFVRAAHWGVGNGWALASMARLAMLVPAHRQDIAARAADLIGRLTPLMRPDGLFHDVVDDPATFPEVNLSQMLAYTLYRGMADGWLPDAYAAQADALYRAACAQVDAYGLMRNVCGAPSFDKPGVAPEGQAFFLLMSAARGKYMGERDKTC